MAVNERTALIQTHKNDKSLMNGINGMNGVNGWQKFEKSEKHIIQIPSEQIFKLEIFSGALSLEELLPYQDDPWWQKLRNTIFYSFWFAIVLTAFTACVLAYVHGTNSCKISTLSTSTINTNTIAELVSSTLPTISTSGKLLLIS